METTAPWEVPVCARGTCAPEVVDRLRPPVNQTIHKYPQALPSHPAPAPLAPRTDQERFMSGTYARNHFKSTTTEDVSNRDCVRSAFALRAVSGMSPLASRFCPSSCRNCQALSAVLHSLVFVTQILYPVYRVSVYRKIRGQQQREVPE